MQKQKKKQGDRIPLKVKQLDRGDPHCPFGGIKLTVGGKRFFVCNGAPGAPGLSIIGPRGPRGEDGTPGTPGPPGIGPGILAVSDNTVDFGTVTVGTSSSQTITLSNTGTGPVTNIAATLTGSSDFSVSGVPSSLAPGAMATVTLTFSPTSAGPAAATVTFTGTNSLTSPTVALSGNGVVGIGALAVTPTALNFGAVPVGSSSSMTVTLSNVGSGTVTSIQGLLAVGTDFSVTNVPSSLAPGASALVTVTFTPTVMGVFFDVLNFTGVNSSTSPSVLLSGQGT